MSRNFDSCFRFWVICEKLLIYPLCSIFSNGGHVVWPVAIKNTNFELDTPRTIVTKFSCNPSSGFRGEDFWRKVNRRRRRRRTTDRRRTPSDDNSSRAGELKTCHINTGNWVKLGNDSSIYPCYLQNILEGPTM